MMSFITLPGIALSIWVTCCTLKVDCLGSRERFHHNGTGVKCQGIVCPKDQIFVPCTDPSGDGKHDTCEPCPRDRPKTKGTLFDSSRFADPPEDFVCVDPHDVCKCEEEAELVNKIECFDTTLNPVCQCRVTSGYYGDDPKLCKLSDNERCKQYGYELNLNGSCTECRENTYKDTKEITSCMSQPSCSFPLVVDKSGNNKEKRTCKLDPRLIMTTVGTPHNTHVETTIVLQDRNTSSKAPGPTTPAYPAHLDLIIVFLISTGIGFCIFTFIIIVLLYRNGCRRGRRQNIGFQEPRSRSLMSTYRYSEPMNKIFKKKEFPGAIPMTSISTSFNQESTPLNGSTNVDSFSSEDETALKRPKGITENNDSDSSFRSKDETALKRPLGMGESNKTGASNVSKDETALKSAASGNDQNTNLLKYTDEEKIISSEETQVKFCNQDHNHQISNTYNDTSSNKVDRQRLCEELVGNTSNKQYMLTWRHDGGNKGFLEYRDLSGNVQRSQNIPNKGFVILVSEKEVKAGNVIFVSNSSYKTQSWVQVEMVEQHESLDLNSLMCSSEMHISLDSFEVVQNRPENYLPSNSFYAPAEDITQIQQPQSTNQVDSAFESTSEMQTNDQSRQNPSVQE